MEILEMDYYRDLNRDQLQELMISSKIIFRSKFLVKKSKGNNYTDFDEFQNNFMFLNSYVDNSWNYLPELDYYFDLENLIIIMNKEVKKATNIMEYSKIMFRIYVAMIFLNYPLKKINNAKKYIFHFDYFIRNFKTNYNNDFIDVIIGSTYDQDINKLLKDHTFKSNNLLTSCVFEKYDIFEKILLNIYENNPKELNRRFFVINDYDLEESNKVSFLEWLIYSMEDNVILKVLKIIIDNKLQRHFVIRKKLIRFMLFTNYDNLKVLKKIDNFVYDKSWVIDILIDKDNFININFKIFKYLLNDKSFEEYYSKDVVQKLFKNCLLKIMDYILTRSIIYQTNEASRLSIDYSIPNIFNNNDKLKLLLKTFSFTDSFEDDRGDVFYQILSEYLYQGTGYFDDDNKKIINCEIYFKVQHFANKYLCSLYNLIYPEKNISVCDFTESLFSKILI